jgi:transcriptional regulator with XRE-family HTH domain
MQFRKWIQSKGLLQKKVAMDLDVDPGHFSRILSGESSATGSLMRKIEHFTKGAVLFADWYPPESDNEGAGNGDDTRAAGEQVEPAAMGQESQNGPDDADKEPGGAGL